MPAFSEKNAKHSLCTNPPPPSLLSIDANTKRMRRQNRSFTDYATSLLGVALRPAPIP